MRTIGYAYPWDYLDDPDAPARAASLGLDAVALAASYHATRAATPTHPTRRVREVPHSALYVPVRAAAWRGQRLVPRAPTWLGDDDVFTTAADRLEGEGLAVEAWIVLSHDDDLGRANPDLVVRNAFGDPYSYSLCPSAPAVVEYCATLVHEIVAATSCAGVVMEACGPTGVEHGGVHEKTDFAQWGPGSRALLSLCFCGSCARALADAGADAEELRARVREGVTLGVASAEEALGEDAAALLTRVRTDASAALRAAVLERIAASGRELRVTLHASSDRWTTGSFCALDGADELAGLDALVASAWDPASAPAEVAGLAAVADGRDVGAYLRLDAANLRGDALAATLGELATRGATEWHLYHLGLATAADLATARRITRGERA